MPFSAPEHSSELAAEAPQAEPARAALVVRRRPASRLRPSQVPARSPQEVLRGSGRPLDAPLREEMENRFDADFSTVRVHADGAARASAAELGARAYTAGEHVVVGGGGADKQTFAHELTHVLQQREGPVAGTSRGGFRVSHPADVHERAAEATARRVLSGSPRPGRGASLPGRSRRAGSRSAPGEPAVQRFVELGDEKYEAPEETDSEYDDERDRFKDEVLEPVIEEYRSRKDHVNDYLEEMKTLLEAYWKAGEIKGGSVEGLTNKVLLEALHKSRKQTDRQKGRDKERSVRTYGTSNRPTRYRKKMNDERSQVEQQTEEQYRARRVATSTPVRLTASKDRVHTQHRGFNSAFSKAYWQVWEDWSEETGKPVRCGICGDEIGDGDERGIDHVKPWNELKTTIPPHDVCKSGHHWTVVLQKDVMTKIHDGPTDPSDLVIIDTKPELDKDKIKKSKEQIKKEEKNRYQTNRRNLQPSHTRCNSGKNAPKDFDAVVPQRIEKDPVHNADAACPRGLEKAE